MWALALIVAFGISLTVAMGATAVSATVDTAPVDTSTDASTDSGPVDTEAPTPSATPVDSTPSETATSADSIAQPNSTIDDGQEDSVSPWWWVVGGLVAFAAFAGIAYSLRRRNADETWARTASTTCDTGRALASTIASHLHEALTWDPPERVVHQRERFTTALRDAEANAPSAQLTELTTNVSARNDALNGTLDALTVGTPIVTAQESLVQPLHDLDEALTALEHEVTTVVYGAALPSTRTTG